MSIAADTFAIAAPEVASPEPKARPISRRFSATKFVVALVAAALIGSGLRAVAEAGVDQAIDNYYGKQAAIYSQPVPELVAAFSMPESAEDAAAAAE